MSLVTAADCPNYAGPEQVAKAEAMFRSGHTPREVARKTGLTKAVVLAVRDRSTGAWKERYLDLRLEYDLLRTECAALRQAVLRWQRHYEEATGRRVPA